VPINLTWQEEFELRLRSIEAMLDKRSIRSLSSNADFGGTNWEVSERHIATWAPGSSLPLDDTDTYAALIGGSLKIRGGGFDISTAASGAHMEFDSLGLRGYDTGGVSSLHLNWSTGTFWFRTGGFGGTEADPSVELDSSGNVSIEGTLTMGANGVISREYVYRLDWGGFYFGNGVYLNFVDDPALAYQHTQGYIQSYSGADNTLFLKSFGNASTVNPAVIDIGVQGYPVDNGTQFHLLLGSAYGLKYTDYNLDPVVLFSSSTLTFNEQGADIDFRIESDTNTYRFWLDASRDVINIGTNATDTIGSVNIYGAANAVWLSGGRTSGSYDGMLYFADGEINSGYNKDADAGGVYINAVGYAGGVTRYRDTFIQDGKGNNIILVDGSAQVTTITGQTRSGTLALTDGVSAPSTVGGLAQIYVDTASGDLCIKWGDGVTKTIIAYA
jgi:hypothetical protein